MQGSSSVFVRRRLGTGLATEDLEWVYLVLVMEKRRDTSVAVCWAYSGPQVQAPELVELLLRKVPPFLPGDIDQL